VRRVERYFFIFWKLIAGMGGRFFLVSGGGNFVEFTAFSAMGRAIKDFNQAA
jgi:hypothetical protein